MYTARQRLLHVAGPILGILIPLLVYIVLKLRPAWDPIIAVPVHHFWIVSYVALLAAAAAVAVGISGSRLRNIQVIFLSMAFTSLALTFSLHGLATPGFIVHRTHIPSVAAQLSVILTAFWLWMSTVPSDHPFVVRLSSRQQLLVPVWTVLLGAYVIVSLMVPDIGRWMPIDRAPLRSVVAAITIALALTAARRYWRSYRYSQFPLQLAIVYNSGWLAVAQVIISTGELWRVSWWIYHFLLLAAVVLLVIGLVVQYGMGASLGVAVRGLFSADPRERVEAGISSSVRALVAANEARDPYTAGHSFRVAILALRLGEIMGLPPEKLRALAQGGVVHDVGKGAVPDQILNKPGALTPEERAVIEKHPLTGFELCKHLGFMKDELDIIRAHHERWDGTGYPDRLLATQIPLLARITAVADVYDALTSDRSYRAARSHAEAHALLIECAGKQFDPACVEAWLRLTESDPSFGGQPSGAAPVRPTRLRSPARLAERAGG